MLRRPASLLAAAAFALAASGCPSDSGVDLPSCAVDDETPTDGALVTVDGDAWEPVANPAQSLPSGVVQFSLTEDANNQVTIRLRTSAIYSADEETGLVVVDEGEPANELVDAGEGSEYEVGDGDRHGADATVILDDATLHTSNADAEGFLSVAFVEDEDTGAVLFEGCGWFDAEEQGGGQTASVTDLSFRLTVQ